MSDGDVVEERQVKLVVPSMDREAMQRIVDKLPDGDKECMARYAQAAVNIQKSLIEATMQLHEAHEEIVKLKGAMQVFFAYTKLHGGELSVHEHDIAALQPDEQFMCYQQEDGTITVRVSRPGTEN